MLTIKTFVFNPFQENTFALYDESMEMIIVDPGINSGREEEILDQFIASQGLKPVAIVNTHCHVDHVLGCRYLKEKYNIPFYCHSHEVSLLENAESFGAFFGLEVDTPPLPDEYLDSLEVFRFGNSELKLLHVPGHSPGSVALYSESDKFVIVGDVLFRNSIGRTDLPGGDHTTLITSIRLKLLNLPSDVRVFPGHGESTTIGYEHDTNPFLK